MVNEYVEIRKETVRLSNYEYLKSIPENTFLELIRRGFLSIDVMSKITIYEYFLHENKTNKKRVAITFACDKYNLSEKTIYNIINFMQS